MSDISVTATCAHCGNIAVISSAADPTIPPGWGYTGVNTQADVWKYLTCSDCLPLVHADIDTKFPHT